jgi:hypothetical protein
LSPALTSQAPNDNTTVANTSTDVAFSMCVSL